MKIIYNQDETQMAYSKMEGPIGTHCSCILCLNVNENLQQGLFPQQLIETCKLFGIDYRFPGEFYALSGSPHENTIEYHGFYCLYGKILESQHFQIDYKNEILLSELPPNIWFEQNSPLGNSNFPKTKDILLIGFGLKLENIKLR